MKLAWAVGKLVLNSEATPKQQKPPHTTIIKVNNVCSWAEWSVTVNLATREADAGGSLEPRTFKVSLSNIDPYLKNNADKTNK